MDITYDFGQDEEGNPYFWVAEIVDPNLPEPHCYRMLYEADETEAIELILKYTLWPSDLVKQHLLKIFAQSN